VTLKRFARWCKQCQWEFYRSFQRAARKRGPAGDAMREAFDRELKRNDFLCVFCGCQLNHVNITEDHIVPLVKGGSGEVANMQFACRSDNSSKQDREVK
jgi:5-methylcytosine-specific restriction endonuclease McrA